MSRGAGSHVSTISRPVSAHRSPKIPLASSVVTGIASLLLTAGAFKLRYHCTHHSRLKAHNIVRTANVEPRAYAAATVRFAPRPEDETTRAGSIIEETLSARLDRMSLMQIQRR